MKTMKTTLGRGSWLGLGAALLFALLAGSAGAAERLLPSAGSTSPTAIVQPSAPGSAQLVPPPIPDDDATSDAGLSPRPTPEARAAAFTKLGQKATKDGQVAVIVGLDVPFVAEADLPSKAAITAQRAAIYAAQEGLEKDLVPLKIKTKRKFKYIPYMAMRLDAAALALLKPRKDIASIEEDSIARPTLASTTQIVGIAPIQRWEYGYDYDGNGQTIAILDSGVDNDHPFLNDIVEEACFSTNDFWTGADSLCPSDGEEQFGSGAGDNCSTSIDGCDHGTHVAGIAAGNGSGGVASFSGVAPRASVIAVQVFSKRTGSTCTDNGDSSPCVRSFKSDQVAALEYVYSLRDDYDIASVNMSLGGGEFSSQTTCANDNGSTEAAVANLRGARIATVVASGNDGFTDALAAPACLPNVISVGNTRDNDNVNSSSNSASFLTLLAPGTSVDSSVPGDNFASKSGTSMAAPHVAGAWAVLKQSFGNKKVKTIRDKLKDAGLAVTDSRNNITKKRIRIDAALPVELVVLSTPQPERTIIAGQTATFTINVQRINLTEQIDLHLGPVPPGVTATLTPTTNVGSTATLTLQTTVSTPSLGTKDVRVYTNQVFHQIVLDVSVVVNAPTPTVSAMSPSSGPPGTQVTITGTNFIGNIGVKFGGVSSPTVTKISNTEIRAAVPAAAISGSVTVTTPGGTRTVPGTFTVTQGPSITSVSPSKGAIGDPVTINGFNLSGVTAVKFGGVSVPNFTVLSATEIETKVPSGASTGPVTVTTATGIAQSPSTFTIMSLNAPPDIDSFSPASGDEGTEITINGSGFGLGVSVKIGNGTATQVTRISSLKLKVRVPATATTGRITITTHTGEATSATNFTRVLQ